MQPEHCVRCFQVFPTEQELGSHYRAVERCQEVPEKRVIDGITDNQERLLRVRSAKEGVNTEEDRWGDVYFILFPNDKESPTPCEYFPFPQFLAYSTGMSWYRDSKCIG